MSPLNQERIDGPVGPEADEFIESLQVHLAQRELELPSYPNVAVQLQRLLADDNVSTDKVVRVVGAEPILAARVVRLASSAALNPRGTPVADLRNAVARLGFNSLRAAATSFAVTQLRLAKQYQGIIGALTELWNENVAMAAAACVVARRCQRVSADTALFAGLVSGVGKICLLARGADSRFMMTHPDDFAQVMRDWHAEVASSLLTRWSVAEDVIEAVQGYQTQRRSAAPALALTDVLSVADVLSEHDVSPELRLEMLLTQNIAPRLGLRAEDCVTLMGDSQAELTLLRTALAF